MGLAQSALDHAVDYACERETFGQPIISHQGLGFLLADMAAAVESVRATTDAVQVLGGYGYTKDFPVERLMREAKVMQIFEGTNQIQRLVIARHLERSARGA